MEDLICACAGSRPGNFPWNYYGLTYSPYISRLYEKVLDLVDMGVTTFICGMAMGVDMDIAETVIKIRKEFNLELRLECAIPFPDQVKGFPYSWKIRYNDIIARADKVTVIGSKYSKQCYHERNRYMIDRCNILFAVWNGKQKGGTAYTIKYAYKMNKKVEILNLTEIEDRD